MINFPTPDGKQAHAYFVDAEAGTDSYLIVFHEWWGLNDYIKKEVDRLSNDLTSVQILAVDLYDGKVATTADQARQYIQGVSEERARNIMKELLTLLAPMRNLPP